MTSPLPDQRTYTGPAHTDDHNLLTKAAKELQGLVAGAVIAVRNVAVATTKLLSGKVTGDTNDRLQITVDGRIVGVSDGTINPSTLTGAQWILNQGASTSDGFVITASSSGSPGQTLLLKDHLGSPICGAGAFGGWKVFGDHLSVYGGGDIFNAVTDFGDDANVRFNKGDVAGGAGVIALGNTIFAPSSNPDGSHTSNGQTTQRGVVMWANGDRLFYRGGDGAQYTVGSVESVTVTKAGTLTTGNIPIRIPLPVNTYVETVAATVNTAPTGSAIILDVLYASGYTAGGLTIYTTSANRPTIAVSTNGVTAAAPDFPACAAPGYLIVNIAQIGSTIAGSDLTVRLRLRRTS